VSNNDELNSNWVLNSIKELCNFVPALKAFKPYKLLPGISCTAGKTDIQDKDSQVHFRSKHMGIYSFDGYFSIDTGKFVSAPLFAKELVKKVEQF
jgi:hypothetical protein